LQPKNFIFNTGNYGDADDQHLLGYVCECGV